MTSTFNTNLYCFLVILYICLVIPFYIMLHYVYAG